MVAHELEQGVGTIAELGVIDQSIGKDGAQAIIEAVSISSIEVLRLLPEHAECLDLSKHSHLARKVHPVNVDDPTDKANWTLF